MCSTMEIDSTVVAALIERCERLEGVADRLDGVVERFASLENMVIKLAGAVERLEQCAQRPMLSACESLPPANAISFSKWCAAFTLPSSCAEEVAEGANRAKTLAREVALEARDVQLSLASTGRGLSRLRVANDGKWNKMTKEHAQALHDRASKSLVCAFATFAQNNPSAYAVGAANVLGSQSTKKDIADFTRELVSALASPPSAR